MNNDDDKDVIMEETPPVAPAPAPTPSPHPSPGPGTESPLAASPASGNPGPEIPMETAPPNHAPLSSPSPDNSVKTESPAPAALPAAPAPEPPAPAAHIPATVKQEAPPPVKQEPAPPPVSAPALGGNLNDSTTVQAILAFLKKNNLTSTTEQLQKELAKAAGNGGQVAAAPKDIEMGNALATYKSDGDPSSYDEAYNDLEVFVENSLDMYKHELALILYPVFVHMYLELVYNGHEQAAKDFIAKFGPRQESYYQEDIKKLSFVTKKDHMKGNELMENFNTSQFTVRMSRDTYTQLRQQKKHLSEKKHTLLWNVIQEHLYLDVYEGLPRSKNQIDSTAGAVTGEANRQANKSKVCLHYKLDPLNLKADFSSGLLWSAPRTGCCPTSSG